MRSRWQLQFTALAVIWGSSFLFIKLIGERWPPLWVAFGRVSLGAATLVAIALARRERLRFPPRIWLHLAVTAVLFNSLPFTLFAYGERHVSSIVAGLWNATTPLWTLLTVIVALPGERPDGRRMLGIAAGFLGAVLILMPWRALGGGRLAGELACGAAALCYGLGFAYMRRFVTGATGGAAALSAGQLICATAQVAVLLPLSSAPSWALGPGRIAGILSLGVLGSGVAYVLNFEVLRRAGAAIASTVTYLVPLFATVLGIVVLGEPLTWNEPLGGAVLLAGVAWAQRAGGTRGPVAGGTTGPLFQRAQVGTGASGPGRRRDPEPATGDAG
jgi:drug/metabolite transporter (DMT)-like permease